MCYRLGSLGAENEVIWRALSPLLDSLGSGNPIEGAVNLDAVEVERIVLQEVRRLRALGVKTSDPSLGGPTGRTEEELAVRCDHNSKYPILLG